MKTLGSYEDLYRNNDGCESMEIPRRGQLLMNCRTLWHHAGGVPRGHFLPVGRSVGRSIGGPVDHGQASVNQYVGRSFDRYAKVLIMQCDTHPAPAARSNTPYGTCSH